MADNLEKLNKLLYSDIDKRLLKLRNGLFRILNGIESFNDYNALKPFFIIYNLSIKR